MRCLLPFPSACSRSYCTAQRGSSPVCRQENWKINSDNMSYGLYVFSAGLLKKVIIADTLSKAVSWGYGNVDAGITSMEGILMMLSYTFQIYFDFSGYSDMATGLGAMFNIKIPMNFNSPYKAVSVVDFWNRWHLTLTRFLRTYVYFSGRKPKGYSSYIHQYYYCFSGQRTVARGKLDIYFLGIPSWSGKCIYQNV